MFLSVLYHWTGPRLFIRDADLQLPYNGIMPSKVSRFRWTFSATDKGTREIRVISYAKTDSFCATALADEP
jgi:hypothetical protein